MATKVNPPQASVPAPAGPSKAFPTGALLAGGHGPARALPPAPGTTGSSLGRRIRRLCGWLVALGILGGGAWGAYLGFKHMTATEAGVKSLTEKVGPRGHLVVTVVEDGNVESAENLDIRCDVAGGSKIKWIIVDGASVEKDAKIVELESSAIDEQVKAQEGVFERAKATKIQADGNAAAAKIAVVEYEQGTHVKELQAVEAQIKIAAESLKSAQNSLMHTARMARKGYVTPLQLDAQKFAVERAKLDMATAETAKTVLTEFTKKKMLEDLKSKLAAAEATAASEAANCKLEEAKLKRLRAQLALCLIRAPQAGMVVYANEMGSGRSGSGGVKIEEGAAVREGQVIVRLPNLARMQVKCLVHESKVQSLRAGMRARIKIQDREFQGGITSVANQPEPGSFFSSSVKEYATIVRIDGEQPNLRPGLTAEVEMLVANLENVVSVPVGAVVEQGGKFYAWVRSGEQAQRREITIGASHDKVVEITQGLSPDEIVLLDPAYEVPEAKEDVRRTGETDVASRFGQGDAGGPTGSGPGGGPAGGGPGAGGEGRGNRDPAAMFKQADKNGDGKLSRDEVPGPMASMFDKLDTNADGLLDPDELAALRRNRGQGAGPPGSGPPGGGNVGGG